MKNNSRGVILMLSFVIMVALAALAGAFLYMVTAQSRRAAQEVESEKAFWIAESGIMYYLANMLDGDTDWSDSGQLGPVSFGDGSFTVTPVTVTKNSIVMRSTGSVQYGILSIERKLEYKAFRDVSKAFSGEYIVYGGGGGGDGEGDVNLDFAQNATITGDMYLAGTWSANSATNLVRDGITEEDQSTAEIPAPDWTYWQGVANAVLTGDQVLSGTSYNGIYYVDGNVSFTNNNVVVSGTIVATGNISVDGNNGTFTPAAGRPAIVSGNNVDLANVNNVIVNGAIYAYSDIYMDQANNITINGTVVFGGSLGADHVNGMIAIIPDPEVIEEGFTGGERYGDGEDGAGGKYNLGAFKEIYD